jgi:AbrB family looped-hinge helix DNA binding protein
MPQIVSMKVTIDKAGRIVVPKSVRDALGLDPGDELENTAERITITPLHDTMPLRQERGVWVYRSGKALLVGVVEETLRTIRGGRESRNLGLGNESRDESLL